MWSNNSFLCILLLALAVGCADAPQYPNVVIILADDMGYGDPGSYNEGSRIPTPHIDGLAQDGMLFQDAHSPSAVCTPTRYGLLTGRYAWRTTLKEWVTNGYSPSLIDTNRLTLPALFQQHGFVTGAVGKWHLGLGMADSVDYRARLRPGPNILGFDYFFGIPASLDFAPYVYIQNEWAVESPSDTIAASHMRRHGGRGFWRAGPIAPSFHHADVLPITRDKAVDFIEQQAQEEHPFFLYVALSAPHTPWLPDSTTMGQSDAGAYGDFVMDVDKTVGSILEALTRTERAQTTLIMFTSDNGAHWLESDIETYGHYANASWRGQKADIWEGGHRIPFIVRWPGVVEPGTSSNQLVSLTDIMATAADMLGVALPLDAGEDSYSLLPVLRGAEKSARTAMVQHSGGGMFAVRKGNWKLILGIGSGGFTRYEPEPEEPAGQLYDLAMDPAEMLNLYTQEPATVQQLTRLLQQYQSEGRSDGR